MCFQTLMSYIYMHFVTIPDTFFLTVDQVIDIIHSMQ